MNVTCERCNTEYDFDDTLVSGRGTTVKCTNCGHLFKVRKKSADPAAAPEKWVVRTVDGRELQFNALRELQGAITQRLIGREDVLSRGSARPRRLGAISELEPFFTSTGAASPHMTTTPGLGSSSLGTSGVAAPPTGTTSPAAAAGATATAARARGTTPQGIPAVKLPSMHTDPDGVMDSSDMQDDATVVRPNPVDPVHVQTAAAPPPPPPNENMFPPPARPDKALGRSSTGKEASPPPVKPPAKEPPPLDKSAMGRSATPAKGTTSPETAPARTSKEPPARPSKEPAKEASPPPEKPAAKPPTKDGAAAAEKPPAKPPVKPPTKDTTPATTKPTTQAAGAESKSEVSSATPPTLPAQRDPSDAAPIRKGAPVAPAKDVKISHMGDDEPRASSTTGKPKSTKKGGGAQRIIAVVAAGFLVFVGVRVYQMYGPKPPPPPDVSADDKITEFLKEADKSLNEGDIQGAQSQLDKASVVAEKNPKVAAELARLAAVQADFKWLRMRLLPMGDPEQPLMKRELDVALDRAKKAVETAQAIAPDDAAVVRRRIDVLRIGGSLQEARKLVSSLPGAGAAPESALVLAALDLAEEKPNWASVIERLRTAVVGEQSIGRARSMLIYALIRSGDVAAAKSEYDQLAGMPRPHPLLAPLREFIARAEAESAAADAGADAGELTVEETIRLANELRAKGEPKRAEEMLLEVLKKNPTNADAAVGLAEIARARNDLGTATRYYEQALKFNGTHLAALTALADIKWDANERQTALGLYRRIVESGGSTAYAAHARRRLGGPIPDDFMTTPPTPPPTTVTTPTYTPPPVPTPTAPPVSTPTETVPPAPTPTPTPTPTPPPTPTGPSIFEPEN